MIAMLFPQQGQDSLVAEYRFPWWFDQQAAGGRQRLAERLAEHQFQRIELEQRFDRAVVEIGVAPVCGEADVLDRDTSGREPHLLRAVVEIRDRALVLCRVAHRGKMERA